MTAEIAPERAAEATTLSRIVAASDPVGGIYAIDYDSAIVLTDDYRKAEVGGIPRTGFLLAASVTGSGSSLRLVEEEVLLLRVRGTAPLPNERDLISTRLQVVRDAYVRQQSFDEVAGNDTLAELQQSAIDCEVVGTFYAQPDGTVEFGSDIDNVYSSTRYQVFLPSVKALSWIASFPRNTGGQDFVIPIGNVRYSATKHKAVLSGRDGARVDVHVSDFVAKKTAVFGMSRVGKSNTIKTIVSSVYHFAQEQKSSIGQVIFDPQGEYANINEQDGTGLRLLGNEEQVRIYTVKPKADQPQEKPLRLNFYDLDLFEVSWDMVVGTMVDADANYVRTFRSTDMEQPDPKDYSAKTHWERGFMAFYGLLARAGYKGDFADGGSISFSMKDDAAAEYNRANPGLNLSGGSGVYVASSPQVCAGVVDWINTMLGLRDKLLKSTKEEDLERADSIGDLVGKWAESDQFTAVGDVFKYAKGRGLAGLRELREFHDPTGHGDLPEMVWDDMRSGRLVIVDLSIGSSVVTKTMSERLVTGLVNKAAERFRDGKRAYPFQIVVEEAHNLFERGKNVSDDPWVRLSKEAAKYKIGLVYATQEVTSVDQRILSNTANWFIGHLNSENETRELSRYYDFATFAGSLRRIEEPGFVRMKTYSGKYIVPVQVSLFDHRMINEARGAAGLLPVNPDGTTMTPAEIRAERKAVEAAAERSAAPAAASKTTSTAPHLLDALKAPAKRAAAKGAAAAPATQPPARPRVGARLGDGEF